MGPRGPYGRRKETLAERESVRTGPATVCGIRRLETQQHPWRLGNTASLGGSQACRVDLYITGIGRACRAQKEAWRLGDEA